MVSAIWFTRRLTIPETLSIYGVFQLRPASATRKNLPKRVMTATCEVLTVKKLPRIVMRTIKPTTSRRTNATMSIETPPQTLDVNYAENYTHAGMQEPCAKMNLSKISCDFKAI